MDKPLVFVSYSREDHREKDELVAHLNVLRHIGIDLWVDDHLAGGDEWERAILDRIGRATVAILLVSENFLSSEFIRTTEMPALERRRQAGLLTLVPVIGRHCAWRSVAWLASLNVRPRGGDPVWAGDEDATRAQLAAIASEIAGLVRGGGPVAAPESSERVTHTPGTPAIYYDPKLRRNQFLRLLGDFSEAIQSEAMERTFGRDALRRWRRDEATIRERLDDEFSLTVIGPFKRGKSTLINALLGREVVTSDIGPETVTINQIRYGDTFTVEACLADGGRVPLAPVQIKREELTRVLGSLPQPVTHLDVRVPVDWLRGVCVVDTPGTGDLLQRFDRTVHDYLTRTDAVLFVLSPLAPLSESERAFLQLAVLPQDFGKLTFVVNMLDKVRDERDVAKAMEYLQVNVERLLPGSSLFGVSALDETARASREPRPLPARSLTLSARFDALRAHLQESILDNRDLIQIDRASADLKRLIQNVAQHAGQLRWARTADRARLGDAIDAYENAASPVHARLLENASHLRDAIDAMGREARTWLDAFLDRLEETARALGGFEIEDLQRHFPFFLADALRTAIHRCLDAHRPLILEEIRASLVRGLPLADLADARDVRQAVRTLDHALDDAGDGTLHSSAAHATFGDGVWDRLEISRVLFDLTQTQVFAVAAGLLRQLDESGRDRQKSMLYQQQFLSACPALRQSVLDQADTVYGSIADRVVSEIERQQQQELETSLDALRQGRQLAVDGFNESQQALLDRLSSLVDETRGAVDALQRKLWSDSEEETSDGRHGVALESPAPS